MTAVRITEAAPGDAVAIAAIYNDVMRSSFTIWSEEPTSAERRATWLAECAARGCPVLTARDRTGLLGFVAAEPFRPWPGYAATWEHSIHVRRDARSRGVGSSLLGAIESALHARDAHVMVAGIDAANDGSLRFHARAGFVETGRLPEVGRLRGTWRHLVLVQKTLGRRR